MSYERQMLNGTFLNGTHTTGSSSPLIGRYCSGMRPNGERWHGRIVVEVKPDLFLVADYGALTIDCIWHNPKDEEERLVTFEEMRDWRFYADEKACETADEAWQDEQIDARDDQARETREEEQRRRFLDHPEGHPDA